MKFLKEITEWSDGTSKNGEYYLNDEKTHMVAFKSFNQTEYKWFKSPIRIDKRGRKFKLIADGEPDSKYFAKPEPEAPVASAIQVTGSNGAIYHVTKRGDSYSCSCSGFQFRRKCKHIESIKVTQ